MQQHMFAILDIISYRAEHVHVYVYMYQLLNTAHKEKTTQFRCLSKG
jgi:hypothetical protein